MDTVKHYMGLGAEPESEGRQLEEGDEHEEQMRGATATAQGGNGPSTVDHESNSETSSEVPNVDEDYSDREFEMLRQQLSRRSGTHDADAMHRIETYNSAALHTGDGFKLETYMREVLHRSGAQGIKSRRSGVCFQDLSVSGINAGVTVQHTLLDLLLSPLRFPQMIRESRHPQYRYIIEGFDGLVRHGEMLLVLGRPGAGCSTFLKALSGNVEAYAGGTSGEIDYNGVPQDVMCTRFKGEVAYNQEVDCHFPTMTVSQTLQFAAEMRTPHVRPNRITRKQYALRMRDMLASTFGLRHTYNTKVGNDFVRGVSGGERKRVSIAETMATRAIVQCWDNSTRGLDASTALEFARALRVMTNLAQTTCIVAIYQAGENIYETFDKVTVLYDGRQIYFGPVESAVRYFEDLGFAHPARQTSADFLTAMTDPIARFPRDGWENKVPRTADEFVSAWRSSVEYADMKREIEEYRQEFPLEKKGEEYSAMKESTRQEKAKHVPKKSPYTVSYPMQVRACIRRSYERMLGNIPFHAANLFASVFQALIMGSVFYDTPNTTSGFFSKGGVLFFAILFQSLTASAEIPGTYEVRPILAKHKSFVMYHPSADALSQIFADIPVKLVSVTAFDIILYFMTGLSRTPSQFFIFYLFTFLSAMTMTSFFRALASITKTVDQAMALGGVGILVLAVFTGYMIPFRDVQWGFRWLKYVNPIQYAFEALMTNEFWYREASCAPSSVVPTGSGYEQFSMANRVCAAAGSTPGTDIVLGRNYVLTYGYSRTHLWRNFGIIIAFWLFYLVVNVVAIEYIKPVSEGAEVLVFRKNGLPQRLEKPGLSNDDLEFQKLRGPEGSSGQDDRSDQKTGATNTGLTSSGSISRINSQQDCSSAQEEQESAQQEAALAQLQENRDYFTWQNVCYDINIKGEKRRLLDDVQGYVKPGTLTALMGESGAGKTTLLNVLAQRVTMGTITGDMLVNGSPLDASFQRRTGYVQQQDVHKPSSTVREALEFSALLRQPWSVPRKEKLEYVDTVIDLLEMRDYADAVVGVPGEGLNVEQRKRLTIGVELAAKPTLLQFLDEPTSGLDSQSAWSIVLFLRKLADAGQAILCTIHQPSAELFGQFDRLLLLKKGGRTVYFGDIGRNSSTLLSYFERNGAPPAGKNENPAELILDYIGAGATATVDRDWGEIWSKSPEYAATRAELDKYHAELRKRGQRELKGQDHWTYATPYWYQTVLVTKREFSHYWRSPTYLMSKLMLNVVAGLFIGFTFFKTGHSSQGLQNKIFAVFMATVLSTPMINQLQPQFIQARSLFETRERPSNMYSWGAFLISAIVVEVPFNLFFGTLFFLPWYYACGFYAGLPDAHYRGGYTWMMYMVYQLYYPTFGQAVAAASPNGETAAILNTLLFSFVIVFTGVLQPYSQLVGFWHFAYRLSPYTYVIEGMMSSMLHGLKIKCKDSEFSILNPPSGMSCGEYLQPYLTKAPGYLNNPQAMESCQYCQYDYADAYLEQMNMSFSHIWRDYGIVWAYVVFNVACTIGLYYMFRVANFSFSMPSFLQRKQQPGGAVGTRSDTVVEKKRPSEHDTD